MARLHEFEGKRLLSDAGIAVPEGGPASTAEEARDIAARLDTPVVLKIQAWTTGRAAIGGVAFATSPDEAFEHATRLLAMQVGAFPVEQVLVEQQLAIKDELFVSLSINDAAREPVMLLSLTGGSGIEDRAAEVHRLECPIGEGPSPERLADLLAASAIEPKFHADISSAVQTIFSVARKTEARSVEVNPLVTTGDGRVLAADCRMTIDDYAVFRHPELGIEIARELDHPPTRLERLAYDVEQNDHRGTFYFAQLNTEADAGSKGLVGFHGAGGGGSMMSMDAITAEGFTIANFTDTSGNPSAAKVYRAARIILSQWGLVGYFGSGSGVASQEQFWSAYGLAKAFNELELDIPAVIRLGGNSEDRAVEILQDACKHLSATVEGYRKDDTPKTIGQRFAALVAESAVEPWEPRDRIIPAFVGESYSFPLEAVGGRVWIDHDRCDEQATATAIELSAGLLREHNGKPVLAVTEEEVAAKDSEFIACEIELMRADCPVLFVDLPVPGLDDH